MPYQVHFENRPAGYAASAARGPGSLQVIVTEFVSSEDGDKLIERLEGLPSQVIAMLPSEAKIKPATLDHMLAVVHRDGSATVYVNELPMVARAMVKRGGIQAGDPLLADDIADISEVTLGDIQVPASAGIIFVFSVRWRKGLFYDLSPLQAESPRPRRYDLSRTLAAFFSYLSYNHLFKISSDDWQLLFRNAWFPFQGLKGETVRNLLAHLRNGWGAEELLPRINQEVVELLPLLQLRCAANPLLKPHEDFFRLAAEHFSKGDFISAISVLYPRLEGIMRAHHFASGQVSKPAHQNLAESVVESAGGDRHPCSLLLPDNFSRFLSEVYFQEFDPKSSDVLSRHSVCHGVAGSPQFSQQGALLGFLILDQLSLLFAGFTETCPGEP